MDKLKRIIDMANDKGFKVVFMKQDDLYTCGFVKNGKWSPPYTGFTVDEMIEDIFDDCGWFNEAAK